MTNNFFYNTGFLTLLLSFIGLSILYGQVTETECIDTIQTKGYFLKQYAIKNFKDQMKSKKNRTKGKEFYVPVDIMSRNAFIPVNDSANSLRDLMDYYSTNKVNFQYTFCFIEDKFTLLNLVCDFTDSVYTNFECTDFRRDELFRVKKDKDFIYEIIYLDATWLKIKLGLKDLNKLHGIYIEDFINRKDDSFSVYYLIGINELKSPLDSGLTDIIQWIPAY